MERMPIGHNADLEEKLEKGPDLVADALREWRRATFEREKKEALLYAQFKGEDRTRTATELKHLINSSSSFDAIMLAEIEAEANHTRLLERHLGNKKIADLRTAY